MQPNTGFMCGKVWEKESMNTKWLPGISTAFFGCLDENVFRECADAGIKLLEISFGSCENSDRVDFPTAKRLSEESGVKLWSFHIPFGPFDTVDPSFIDENKRKYTVEKFCGYIKNAAAAGVETAVIHASGEPITTERPRRLEAAKKSFREIAEYSKNLGVKVAVEDLPRSCIGHCSDEIAEILSVSDNIGVAFDTNHLTIQDNLDFIAAVGRKIITTHFSDYDFIDERHLLPGEGRIDWKRLMEALDRAGYEGPVIYELSRGSTKNIARKAPLSAKDIIKNHSALVSYRQPEPVDFFTAL